MMTNNARSDHRRDNVRSFLKALRLRLDPLTSTIGEYHRISSRRGRPISQEEIAEAVGVSRVWYALLESGAPVQPSVSLLHRLAHALNATPGERAMLFSVAIPALESVVTATVK
jgi:DNA-binding XRE family transcriptional regulator